MTALGKVVRTTAFKLSAIYIAVFTIFAIFFVLYISYSTNVLLNQHGDVKYWLAAGMNDTASLGAVRALEGRGFTPDTAVAIGINGTDCIDELKKPPPPASPAESSSPAPTSNRN